MGSGNDIEQAWDELSTSAYELGYFDPFAYCNYKTYRGGLPTGIDDEKIKENIKESFNDLRKKTTEILKNNKDLIVSVALKLGDIGEMSGDEFLGFIKKNKGTLTEERMKEAKESFSYDYYKQMLDKMSKEKPERS